MKAAAAWAVASVSIATTGYLLGETPYELVDAVYWFGLGMLAYRLLIVGQESC